MKIFPGSVAIRLMDVHGVDFDTLQYWLLQDGWALDVIGFLSAGEANPNFPPYRLYQLLSTSSCQVAVLCPPKSSTNNLD